MNTQQRQQERIRLWEMERDAAYRICQQINDMRRYGSCDGVLGRAVGFEYVDAVDPQTSQTPSE